MKLIIVIISAFILKETNGELPCCINKVMNGVREAATTFYDAGKNIINSYTNLAKATYESFQRLTGETMNMLKSAINEMISGVNCFMGQIKRSFENVIGTLSSLIEGAGTGAANGAIKRLIERIQVIEGMIDNALKKANEIYREQIQKINGTIADKVDKIFVYLDNVRQQYVDVKEAAKETVLGMLDEMSRDTNRQIEEAIPPIFKMIETKYQKTIDVFQKVMSDVAAVVNEVKICKENRLGDLLKCSVEAKMKLPSESEIKECISKMETNLNNMNWDSLVDYSNLNQIEDDLEENVRETQRKIEEYMGSFNPTTKREEPTTAAPVQQAFNEMASSITRNVEINKKKIFEALLQVNSIIEGHIEKYKTILRTKTVEISNNVMKMLPDKEASCAQDQGAIQYINNFKQETDNVIKACYNDGLEPLEQTFREITHPVAHITPRLDEILNNLSECAKPSDNLNPMECANRLLNTLPSDEEIDNAIEEMFEKIQAITIEPLVSKSCLPAIIDTIGKMTQDLKKNLGDLCDSKEIVFEAPTL